MGKNNNSSNNKTAESKGGRLANFLNNFVRDPSTTIIGAGLEVLADVAGGTVRAVYNAYDRTREYIHDKKMARKMKREEEARMLNESFQQQNQEIQQQQIQSSQRFAESFGDDSYDVERASAEEVRRMSRELERIRSEFKNNAEDIERKIVDFVQDSIKDMIKEFEEINAHQIGSSSLNLNISYLKSLENQMENQITGFIQNNVKRRLSIDSDECADILRISGKAAKKNAMKDYQNTIFDDAVKSLWEMINDSIRSQNDLVYSQISNRLNAMEIAAEESMKQLEEIRKAKELNEEEVAAKQSEFQNMTDIASWCLEELTKEIPA